MGCYHRLRNSRFRQAEITDRLSSTTVPRSRMTYCYCRFPFARAVCPRQSASVSSRVVGRSWLVLYQQIHNPEDFIHRCRMVRSLLVFVQCTGAGGHLCGNCQDTVTRKTLHGRMISEAVSLRSVRTFRRSNLSHGLVLLR